MAVAPREFLGTIHYIYIGMAVHKNTITRFMELPAYYFPFVRQKPDNEKLKVCTVKLLTLLMLYV